MLLPAMIVCRRFVELSRTFASPREQLNKARRCAENLEFRPYFALPGCDRRARQQNSS
jgi:hypothetical protein